MCFVPLARDGNVKIPFFVTLVGSPQGAKSSFRGNRDVKMAKLLFDCLNTSAFSGFVSWVARTQCSLCFEEWTAQSAWVSVVGGHPCEFAPMDFDLSALSQLPQVTPRYALRHRGIASTEAGERG